MAHRILCFLIRVYSCVSWAEPSVAGLVTWARVLTHRGDEQLNTLEEQEKRSHE